ncbi:MAG: porphobilinogen synthase [candidate division Zixibacteria bacterium]|nr:porphobilinogen synthase [candidate division Zixibacteria bacterium]
MDYWPIRRPRRLRRNSIIRDLVAETRISAERLIQPYFVSDEVTERYEIPGMPGIFRETPDQLVKSIEDDLKLGIRRVMLFGVTDDKHADARSAYADDNPAVVAIEKLRDQFSDDLFISADVCLCAYTDSGHCGLLNEHEVDNDESLSVLAKMAVRLAEAGVDWVAPSDMMDGRVGAIRQALDDAGFPNTAILAYTAKYASAYYGPFREAAESAPQHGDRKSYQMDWRNRREARTEAQLDIEEGADIIMVKPALAYLDVISDVAAATDLPVAAYNVSGEYTAVKLMAQHGFADERDLVMENLTAITRAGASIILTYHLRDMLREGWITS